MHFARQIGDPKSFMFHISRNDFTDKLDERFFYSVPDFHRTVATMIGEDISGNL
jgi:hypothetical protein